MRRVRAPWAVWANLFVWVALSGSAWADATGPRYRPDGWRAREFGSAEGYPVGGAATREQQKFLVGAYSRGDKLQRARSIAADSLPARLARAPHEPEIRYEWGFKLQSLDEYLDRRPVTGLLVARGERILIERYQYDRREGDRFTSQSMAKTVIGLLVGIALAEGRIHSIDDLADRYVGALRGSEFGNTPIKAFLQMSSGIAFRHAFDADSAVGDLAVLNRGPGGAKGLLQFNRRAAPPGTRFNYSAADTKALCLVLAAATGMTVSDYAREKLWRPLGAESDASWEIDRAGYEKASCCFAATLRDWARLGLMLAHDGAWRGRQIVPREWLLAATTVAAGDERLKPGTATRTDGYGYQVWLLQGPGRMFALKGLRGQRVFVDPDTKTVMVHTAVMPYQHDDEAAALWRGVLQSLR